MSLYVRYSEIFISGFLAHLTNNINQKITQTITIIVCYSLAPPFSIFEKIGIDFRNGYSDLISPDTFPTRSIKSINVTGHE